MRRQDRILHPPEDLKEIHAFYYNNKQIILLYSISSIQSEWIKIYKENHSYNQDIETWCQSHYVSYEVLNKRCSRVFEKFIRENAMK